MTQKRPKFVFELSQSRRSRELTRVSINKEKLVSRVQVVDDSSFGEIGHVSHILQEFVLGRVLWLDIFGLEKLDFTVSLSLDFDLAILLTELFTLNYSSQ